MIYHILCLPTFGSPYLVATVESKKYDISEDHLKALQKAVGGYIEPIPRDSFLIHPMFCENKRWLMAKQMLSRVHAGLHRAVVRDVKERGRVLLPRLEPKDGKVKRGVGADELKL